MVPVAKRLDGRAVLRGSQVAWLGRFSVPVCSCGLQRPPGLVVAEPEDREPGPVERSGAGDQVGGDAGQAAGAGPPTAPGPAGEVGDLALDDGPVRFVALLPGRVALGGAGALQHRLVRVDGDGAPAPGSGACGTQRAGGAPGAERGPAVAAGGRDDSSGLPGRYREPSRSRSPSSTRGSSKPCCTCALPSAREQFSQVSAHSAGSTRNLAWARTTRLLQHR